MFDFGAIMKALPSIQEMAPKAHEFMSEWTKFMNHLKPILDRIDYRTESIDNKVQTIINMTQEAHARPEIFSDVLVMAAEDPRGKRLMVPGLGEPIQ